MSEDKYLIVVAGPTAVGKTDVAIRLAEHFSTSILSADSRQCFKELNIGTAKPSADDLARVPHYFINSHSIFEDVSAATYESYALDILEELFSKNKIVVLCGGTGLYIRALLYGLDEMPPVDAQIEEDVNNGYQQNGIGWLQDQIRKLDPRYAKEGVMDNPARLLRALSFVRAHQRSILEFRTGCMQPRAFKVVGLGLELPREVLYHRINARVDEMVGSGLVEEARQFFPYRHLKNLQTVGYQEFYVYGDQFPQDKEQLEQAIEKIKQHTRNYAKRQLTWFKNKERLAWFSPLDWDGILQFVNHEIKKN